MDDEIPAAVLASHPELVAVREALEQLRDGKTVTARCVECDKLLVAEDVEATGVLVVRCPDGHTHVRVRRANAALAEPRGQ